MRLKYIPRRKVNTSAPERLVKLESNGRAAVLNYNVPEATSYTGRNYLELQVPVSYFNSSVGGGSAPKPFVADGRFGNVSIDYYNGLLPKNIIVREQFFTIHNEHDNLRNDFILHCDQLLTKQRIEERIFLARHVKGKEKPREC